MAIEIKLPDLGEGIESGDVLEVLVNEGDTIAKDASIIEIETDKATVEVPSSHGGKITKIHVSSGDKVNVGDVIATLEAAESPAKAAPKQQAPAPAAKAEEAPAKEEAPAEEVAEEEVAEEAAVEEKPAPKPTPAKKAAPVAKAKPTPAPQANTAASERAVGVAIAAGPAVRRFAREVGVDLDTVTGSGPNGRITRDDVLSVVRSANKAVQGGKVAKAAAPATSKAAEPDTSEALPGEPGEDKWGPIRTERMTKIRRTIATKMHESWSTVPRVTNFDDADITELEKIRQASKDDYAETGIKLTTMPFVIKACALALEQHPLLNSTIDMENEQITYKDYVNIGIAVDSERGLVVPALRAVNEMSFSEIAQALGAVAKNVREGSFKLEDLRGGTFTISNLGAIGGKYSTPIINVPEVAILLVGRAREMPVVRKGEIVARLMLPLSLSYDHRLVDGATAGRFLNDVIAYLQAPSRLLLAP